MHKALFLIMTVPFLILGCGEVGENEYGGIPKDDVAVLRTINLSHEENISALKLAFDSFVIAAAPSDKLQKMSTMLSDLCIAPSELLPENELTGGKHESVVQGEDCPIYWNRYRFYNTAEEVFIMNENFESRMPSYRALSPVLTRRATGTYRLVGAGMARVVRGNIEFSDYKVSEVGLVNAAIQIESKIRGVSHVTLSIAARNMNHQASIAWDKSDFHPSYMINGKEVDRRNFEELFSSFELIKIMDNSMNML